MEQNSDDTDNLAPFAFSTTAKVWVTVNDGVLRVKIYGTPEDFKCLGDIAARSGGSVILSTVIQDGQSLCG